MEHLLLALSLSLTRFREGYLSASFLPFEIIDRQLPHSETRAKYPPSRLSDCIDPFRDFWFISIKIVR